MATIQPIDRTKKSNRRCINCIHWKNRDQRAISKYSDKPFHCGAAGKDIEYWNCCDYFQWEPSKTYIN